MFIEWATLLLSSSKIPFQPLICWPLWSIKWQEVYWDNNLTERGEKVCSPNTWFFTGLSGFSILLFCSDNYWRYTVWRILNIIQTCRKSCGWRMFSSLFIKSADPNFRPLIFLYDPMKTYELKLDTMQYCPMWAVSL